MRVYVPQMPLKWPYRMRRKCQKSLVRNDIAALAQMAEQRTRNLVVSPSQMALLGVNCPSQRGVNVATSGVKRGVRPSPGVGIEPTVNRTGLKLPVPLVQRRSLEAVPALVG
jgi:hypothetical protein